MAVKEGVQPGVIPYLALLVQLAAGYFIYRKQFGKGFIFQSLTIALVTVSAFLALFPRVMISSLNPEWSLTIYNASSSPYTLQVMSIVASDLCSHRTWSTWMDILDIPQAGRE